MLYNQLGKTIQEQMKYKIRLGNIFYISDFEFENTKETRNKYCIVLSNTEEYFYVLFCLTTSKVEKYQKILSSKDYIIIPANISCFPLETMIRVDNQNIMKISEDDFSRLTSNWQGTLPKEYLDELLQKIKNSSKVSKIFKDILFLG